MLENCITNRTSVLINAETHLAPQGHPGLVDIEEFNLVLHNLDLLSPFQIHSCEENLDVQRLRSACIC